jgi:hypothetical protein
MESTQNFDLLDSITRDKIDQLIYDGSILLAIIEIRRAFNIESLKDATEIHFARYTSLKQNNATTFKEPNPEIYWKGFHD